MKNCIESDFYTINRMRYLMDTFCAIRAEGKDRALVGQIVEEAFSELKRIEMLLSRYLDDSVVSKINRTACEQALKVDDEVFGLLGRSVELSRRTFGAFDITIGAAIDFWRRAQLEGALPQKNEIEDLRVKIGYQNLILDSNKNTIYFKRCGVKIDLGAFAKGYALDRAAVLLKQAGVNNALINLGGNIYVIDESPQTIAIRNPMLDNEALTTVDITTGSISTSANYERYFTIKGKRFSHILNPMTACPVESDVLSVSIISQDATLADALSTAVFVLGLDKAKDLMAAFKGSEAVVVSKNNSEITTHNMRGG